MTTVFSQYFKLQQFLADEKRPEGTLNFYQLYGFLMAVACVPDQIDFDEWLPVVFRDGDPQFKDAKEEHAITLLLMALFDEIAEALFDGEYTLPEGCILSEYQKLKDESRLSQWAMGFLVGHDWLVEIWDAEMNAINDDELDEELGACVMIFSFFAAEAIAKGIHQDMLVEKPFEQAVTEMYQTLPDAIESYSIIESEIEKIKIAKMADGKKSVGKTKNGKANKKAFNPYGKKTKH